MNRLLLYQIMWKEKQERKKVFYWIMYLSKLCFYCILDLAVRYQGGFFYSMFIAKLCYIHAWLVGIMKGTSRYIWKAFIQCKCFLLVFSTMKYIFALMERKWVEAVLLFQDVYAAVRRVCWPSRRVLLRDHDPHLLPLHGQLRHRPHMARSPLLAEVRLKLYFRFTNLMVCVRIFLLAWVTQKPAFSQEESSPSSSEIFEKMKLMFWDGELYISAGGRQYLVLVHLAPGPLLHHHRGLVRNTSLRSLLSSQEEKLCSLTLYVFCLVMLLIIYLLLAGSLIYYIWSCMQVRRQTSDLLFFKTIGLFWI